jgi:ubiquitin C-terminal hydrolase
MFDYASKIKDCPLIPGSTAYLVSSNFVDTIEKVKGGKRSKPRINNKDLVQSGRPKTTLKRGQHFYAVSHELWDELLDSFGGGPAVECVVLNDGEIELGKPTFSIKRGRESKSISFSRGGQMEDFVEQIQGMFSVRPPIRLLRSNSTMEIPQTGTVGECVGSETKIELEAELAAPAPAPERTATPRKKPTRGQQRPTRAAVSASTSARGSGLRNLGNTCYMNASLQGLASFDLLISNLGKIQSEASDPRITTAFVGIMRALRGGSAVVDPSSFKAAVSIALPFFKGRHQEDAHEFTTFLLDVVKEECRNPNGTFASLLYGMFESTTTCAHCNHPEMVAERFSSLSTSVSESRRFTFSPYDLKKPMERLLQPPAGIPLLFIAKDSEGANIISAENSSDFVEAYLLERPALDPEFTCALLRLVDAKQKTLQKPLLMQVPIGTNITAEALTCRVADRIRGICKTPNVKVTLLSPPSRFTLHSDGLRAVEPVTAQVTQPLLDIRVTPIIPATTVSELVASFFTDVRLDSENKWKCEACGEETCALRHVSLRVAPPNLIVQFKRFKARSTKGLARDNSEVILDDTLDLAPFAVDGAALKYRLVGVVCHAGGMSFGHYTAYGRRGGPWCSFNDSQVTERAPPTGPTAAPYVLFYERIPGGEAPPPEEAVMELEKRDGQSDSAAEDLPDGEQCGVVAEDREAESAGNAGGQETAEALTVGAPAEGEEHHEEGDPGEAIAEDNTNAADDRDDESEEHPKGVGKGVTVHDGGAEVITQMEGAVGRTSHLAVPRQVADTFPFGNTDLPGG